MNETIIRPITPDPKQKGGVRKEQAPLTEDAN